MAEHGPQREPTIAEILSTIRGMLSEDGDRGAGAEPIAPAAAPALSGPQEPPPEDGGAAVEDDGVLDLTEAVQDDGTVVTLEAVRTRAREPRAEMGSTADAFVLLAAAVHSRETQLGDGGRTVEDIVRELLRPMLRTWLDRHLRPIVSRAVEREIARVARRTADE